MFSASQYTDALNVIKSSGFRLMTHHKEAVTATALTAGREWTVRVMTDYIKREDAIKTIESETYRHDYLDHVIDIIEAIPSADVAPVRHGRWIEHYKSDAPPTLKERWICSWCGNVQTYGATGYCPNCGADMRRNE